MIYSRLYGGKEKIMNKWTMLLVGLVATIALLAAACGTGSDDEDTPVPVATASSGGATTLY